jgi:glutaredoxin
MSQSATPSQTQKPEIVFYSKSDCPWSRAVRHLLDQHGFAYDERFIDKYPQLLEELRSETNQEAQPTLKVGGEWLIDVDANQVARHLNLPEPAEVKLSA